ncbi:hypothetical protein RJ640_002798 [Escallonia rubra]|uniref:DNA (cytosine-5-)-methyltransferase n=1 Tax=Escallonia rubra TaxID=112253 RepID=A0AA88RWL1_9ASTE|nr:hypothetical protein RJ640_002798 [Escallonia rubra]
MEEESPVWEEESPSSRSTRKIQARVRAADDEEEASQFVGDPYEDDEAKQLWPHRYFPRKKKGQDNQEEIIQATRHYKQALVDGRVVFDLGDDCYVKGEEGKDNYICRIVEMFEGVDGLPYISSQWFYRASDTVIKDCSNFIDDKRLFLSDVKDDNPLDCLIEKLKIVRMPLEVRMSLLHGNNPSFLRLLKKRFFHQADFATKQAALSNAEFYCDMQYLVLYSSFLRFPPGICSFCPALLLVFQIKILLYILFVSQEKRCAAENARDGSESDSTISCEADLTGNAGGGMFAKEEVIEDKSSLVVTLLDLYSGCGAMSTGLCLGANLSGVKLTTKWAVDMNEHACASLKLNHPETQVRNECAEDFLMLLKEWQKLCATFVKLGYGDSAIMQEDEADEQSSVDDDDDAGEDEGEVYEVEKVLSICYGDPKKIKEGGLYLKIRWKGYGPDEDTWEPIETLGYANIPRNSSFFAYYPYATRGMSGFNRHRNKEDPLADEKNKQLAVYMDTVEFLKPKFVLMENVVDILRFAGGFLGRYALGRLVGMNYQARVGIMPAGAYGLPQFRMRMFMWGARATENLPKYPLPTHDVVVRGNTPVEFKSNAVDYDEGHEVELEKKVFLGDAISDLPPVKNDEARDSMAYMGEPETEFQRFIRLRKDEMPGCSASGLSQHDLFDHRPLELNKDDYLRVCQVPKKKGASFRNLKGVRVMADNKVEFDPEVERVLLPSGKPLVPDYAMSYIKGYSSKPFGRLWWDQTVPTVVTRAEPHNQVILHPEQDRVLTIRENARLQGFPDYYQLVGPVKQRYIQVGNAVAVPVARALGYALGLAFTSSCDSANPVFWPLSDPSVAKLAAGNLVECEL